LSITKTDRKLLNTFLVLNWKERKKQDRIEFKIIKVLKTNYQPIQIQCFKEEIKKSSFKLYGIGVYQGEKRHHSDW